MPKSKTEKNVKQSIIKRAWEEFLFWGHIAIIFAFILSGLIIPLQILVLLLILWNIHLMILGRCIITIVQDKINEGSTENQINELPFIDRAYERFTGKQLSERAFDTLLLLIPTLALSFALLADVLKLEVL